jgi:hypothetical protein
LAWNASQITSKVIGQPYVVGIGSTEQIDLTSDAGRGHLVLDKNTLTEWKQAFAHEIIARRFERAVFRPWQRVDADMGRILE